MEEEERLHPAATDPEQARLDEIRENLRLTPLERLEKHRRGLETLAALRELGRDHRRRQAGRDPGQA